VEAMAAGREEVEMVEVVKEELEMVEAMDLVEAPSLKLKSERR